MLVFAATFPRMGLVIGQLSLLISSGQLVISSGRCQEQSYIDLQYVVQEEDGRVPNF
jgi:hypothetical protein